MTSNYCTTFFVHMLLEKVASFSTDSFAILYARAVYAAKEMSNGRAVIQSTTRVILTRRLRIEIRGL